MKLWDNWGWESCNGWSGQCLSLRDWEFHIQSSPCLSAFWRSVGQQRLTTDPNPSAWEWVELRQMQQKFLLMGPEESPSDRLKLYPNSEECPCLSILLGHWKGGDFNALLSCRIFNPVFFWKGRSSHWILGTVILKVICEQSVTIPCLSTLLNSACSDTSFRGFNHFLRNAAS